MDSDESLLERLRAGDDAFAILVERYHSRLIKLARSLVCRPDIAEDIAQETWIAVLRGIGRFEARSALRTWLFQNLCQPGQVDRNSRASDDPG